MKLTIGNFARALVAVLWMTFGMTAQAQSMNMDFSSIQSRIAELSRQEQFLDAAVAGSQWIETNFSRSSTQAMEVADVAVMTGTAFYHGGNFEQAINFLKIAISISDHRLGLEDIYVASPLNRLANTYLAFGKHEMALPLHQRALEIRKKVLGNEHPDTAVSLRNLALTFRHLGQHGKALPLQLRVIAIDEKVLWPDHPNTAGDLGNRFVSRICGPVLALEACQARDTGRVL